MSALKGEWGPSARYDGCGFVVWFEAAGKRLTDQQLRDLVEKGKTRKSKWAPGTAAGAPLTGRLVLDLAGPRESGAARFERE